MLKKILYVVVIGFALYSCANDIKEEKENSIKEATIDSTLLTDSSWGLITAKIDIEGLKEIYGETNVIDERICGPECVDSIDVTIVYRETNKEFIVYWEDNAYHKAISMVFANGEAAPYHTASGLRIGSTMQDLLNENEKPINFLGFGWDYGGGISNYNKGRLDSSNLGFRLDLIGESFDDSLFGDIELNTEMPYVKSQLSKIKIYQIYLYFNNQ